MKSRDFVEIFRRRHPVYAVLACVLSGLLTPFSPALAQSVGTETGKPLPRFEAMKFDKVRLRRGPGEEYPIALLYIRKGLPIQIFREYQDWRQVRDSDGDTGWIKRNQLTSKRYGMVIINDAPLYRQPDQGATVIAKAQEGVVFDLSECGAVWCRGSVDGYKGYIAKSMLWGVFPQEEFNGE